jgi:hypothetical protein
MIPRGIFQTSDPGMAHTADTLVSLKQHRNINFLGKGDVVQLCPPLVLIFYQRIRMCLSPLLAFLRICVFVAASLRPHATGCAITTTISRCLHLSLFATSWLLTPLLRMGTSAYSPARRESISAALVPRELHARLGFFTGHTDFWSNPAGPPQRQAPACRIGAPGRPCRRETVTQAQQPHGDHQQGLTPLQPLACGQVGHRFWRMLGAACLTDRVVPIRCLHMLHEGGERFRMVVFRAQQLVSSWVSSTGPPVRRKVGVSRPATSSTGWFGGYATGATRT